MKIVFSWDDGAPEDRKLFDLHEKYEIPAMFFVPNMNVEGRNVLSPSEIKNSESKYIRFGGHTENHRYLTEISQDKVECEIKNNKIYLEDILSHEVESFCFPGGRYNDDILLKTKKYYKYLRTADTMFFDKPKNNILKPTIHFYPRGMKSLLGNAARSGSYSEIVKLLLSFRENYFDVIKILLLYEKEEDIVFSIWGHSWEIEENGLWNELDNLLKYVKEEFNNKCYLFEGVF